LDAVTVIKITGNEISRQDIINNLNHPRNALLLQADVHKAFDNLEWGIEAITHDDGTVSSC
jgi:hypothetical protein